MMVNIQQKHLFFEELSLGKKDFDYTDSINLIKTVLINLLSDKDMDCQINILNSTKQLLHELSPFKNEPVDCVLWIKNEFVIANDYNPNTVAPPEMELLKVSIDSDGFTQPIVVFDETGTKIVVDGFHRNRVGKECSEIRERLNGYLPVTIIRSGRENRNDRIASTIRHNRARGRHKVDAMSDIVIELKNRNWTNERIAKELGMDQDEILRLCQITGLAGLFSDQEFSKSWDIEDSEPDFLPLTEEFDLEETDKFRTVNTGDPNRIFHSHDKWECYKAGFYSTTKEGMKKEECEKVYAEFLSNSDDFANALEHIIKNWKNSCEHYLTNGAMNRIAWLGQAALCYAKGIPSIYRGGFNLLTGEQQICANKIALKYLNLWLIANDREEIDMSQALSDNQMDLY
jgi:ParB-like chromosome segregation protein Spo0J